MARKNRNRRPNLHIAKGRHFMYSPHEFGEDACVVRYLGEQDGDQLLVFHPEGYAIWVHMHNLWNPKKAAA